jgi:GH15 family glucan-1,4-alpha-glucosidase
MTAAIAETPTKARASTPHPRPVTSRILIEDHALIGDRNTAALVAKDGSIDFLCLPDFDSDACFTALLGTADNGRWRIAPVDPVQAVRRRYRGDTLVLETELETATGAIRLIDFMPPRRGAPRLVRMIEGLRGDVRVRFDLAPRFAYGLTVPKERVRDGQSAAIAGPDALYLQGPGAVAPPFQTELVVRAGELVPYVLSWARPYEAMPERIDPRQALCDTEAYWTRWVSTIEAPLLYRDLVIRSLLTLKACTYQPSGAIVAAPTFGLPESPGGERNWDYRFCWIRDASLTLNALMHAGLVDEARSFGNWMIDAIGGAASQLQIMYGIRGERRLTEVSLDWLAGYGGAHPVRIGNGAYTQFQLDVLGEFAAVLFAFAEIVGALDDRARDVLEDVATTVAAVWQREDHGIWEMRGPERSFTASKVAAWTTIDRWVRAIERFALKVDKQPWEKLRKVIHDDVCKRGYDPVRNTFTQYYGSKTVDASLLQLLGAGFLPPDDPRMVGTVKAIEEELLQDGLVLRYQTGASNDGLTGEEGVFLACSFWLVNAYRMMGRDDDARELFDHVISLCNDVGLLAEEYLPREKQQTGNFPQAFSHLALVTCAYGLAEGASPLACPKR